MPNPARSVHPTTASRRPRRSGGGDPIPAWRAIGPLLALLWLCPSTSAPTTMTPLAEQVPVATPAATASPSPTETATTTETATPALTATPTSLPAPAASPSPISGATVRGRVVEGYAARRPVPYLSLWLGSEPQAQSAAYTDENGEFVLTGMPAGTLQLTAWALSFEVSVPEGATTVDLGTLKYPVMHVPPEFWWTPTPLPSLAELLANGEAVEFSVCFADSEWRRPTEEEQRQRVWSCRPFSDKAELEWWFQRPAMLYDGMDLFRQSFAGAPNVDPPAADRRFLLGAWTSASLAESGCPYDAAVLDDLAVRNELEVWLLGYEAVEVRQLGGHYAVQVAPADGLQIIRFPGNGGSLEVHIVHDGVEVVELPNHPFADIY